MQKKLQNLFTKDKVLVISPILFFISMAVADFFTLNHYGKYGYQYLATDLFLGINIILICISYKKHDKNVTKALLGAMLVEASYTAISNAVYYIAYEGQVVDVICSCVLCVCWVIFFFNHLKLASNHRPDSSTISLNQVLAVLIMLASVVWEVVSACTVEGYEVVYAICNAVFDISIVSIAIFVETKIDFFKKNREISTDTDV